MEEVNTTSHSFVSKFLRVSEHHSPVKPSGLWSPKHVWVALVLQSESSCLTKQAQTQVVYGNIPAQPLCPSQVPRYLSAHVGAVALKHNGCVVVAALFKKRWEITGPLKKRKTI